MIFKLLNGAAIAIQSIDTPVAFVAYWPYDWTLFGFEFQVEHWKEYKNVLQYFTKSVIFDKNQWKSVWSKPKSTPLRQNFFLEIWPHDSQFSQRKEFDRWFSVVLKLRPLYIHERATWKVYSKTNLLYI